MHIVLVVDQYDELTNGTVATARRFAEALRARGHTVTVLAAGAAEPDKVDARVLHIPFFQKLIEKQGALLAKASDEKYFEAFEGADIIHFYMPSPFCRRGEFIARDMKIPTMAAFHIQPENVTYNFGLGKNKAANRWLYRFLYRYFYSRFRFIHCPSEFIAGQLKKNGYDADLRVFSNGVSRNFIPIKTPKKPEWAGKFVVLMVGRLSGEKRQDVIIRAVQKSRYADNIQLVFAGRGPEEGKLRRMAKNLKNPPVFGFYNQKELLRVINESDLYIHASDAEIEGISCLEAMACGLVPVISDSPLSATNAFAMDSKCLFAAGDSQSLAERIDYWYEHPKERITLGERYAKRADTMRVENSACEVERLYMDCIREYKENGPKPYYESLLRRLTHPKPEAANNAYIRSFSRSRRISGFLINCAAALLAAIDFLCFGLEVHGRHQIRNISGGAVTVSNHVHFMDCTMVKVAAFPRRIYFTSQSSNFQIPFTGWLVRILGALRLPESSGELVRLQRYLCRGLKRGDIIHFYPEGILLPFNGNLHPFRLGAFYAAVSAGCPVVPMMISQAPKHGLRKLLLRKKIIRLDIGEPQYPDARFPRLEAARELAVRVRDEMKRLNEKENTQDDCRRYA